jgi:isopenicillin N synthase-like dioxygenase
MSTRKEKLDGIGAQNREFRRHDQVEKRQSYRLAEGGVEDFDETTKIRTCDIGPVLAGGSLDGFASELGSALEEIGFAILTGHGVDRSLFTECETAVEKLFTEHSLEEKLSFRASRHGSVNQGYFPIQETSDIHPDLVEGWVFCRRAFALDGGAPPPTPIGGFWPDPSYELCFRRLVLAQEKLILPVMQAILTHLGCDPHLYDKRLSGTNIGLRLNYYPPILDPGGPISEAGRLLGHEDVDLFTFLPAPRVEGLQVLNRANFRWIRLAAPPGSIILNTGDYMQRITNDRLPSTTHRVSQPRDAIARASSRVSFPLNVYLWEQEVLEVLPGLPDPKYPPVSALRFHTQATAKYYGDGYAASALDEE